jgi:hypothetical protein
MGISSTGRITQVKSGKQKPSSSDTFSLRRIRHQWAPSVQLSAAGPRYSSLLPPPQRSSLTALASATRRHPPFLFSTPILPARSVSLPPFLHSLTCLVRLRRTAASLYVGTIRKSISALSDLGVHIWPDMAHKASSGALGHLSGLIWSRNLIRPDTDFRSFPPGETGTRKL